MNNSSRKLKILLGFPKISSIIMVNKNIQLFTLTITPYILAYLKIRISIPYTLLHRCKRKCNFLLFLKILINLIYAKNNFS